MSRTIFSRFSSSARRAANNAAGRISFTPSTSTIAARNISTLSNSLTSSSSLPLSSSLCAAVNPLPSSFLRGISTIDFGGVKEKVVERADYPKDKLVKLFGGETFAMIGYGTQGRAQALNLRDNGFNVIVGLREGSSWELAKQDGFIPGKTLFPITDAVKKANTVMYLLSDAGQKSEWPVISPLLKRGQTLYFSHGFSVVYADQTGVIPPNFVDVILVAPKGSGTSVRRLFLEGKGINSSVAVHQDVSGKAWDRAYGIGVAVGSGYLFETTFKKEVYSDLTGERGVLMGAIAGLMQAQYEVLRANGHSPSEAFNETVEEATQSLYPLVGEKGMDWMYANCSTTAQRGALDWSPKFYKASLPIFELLYESVATGRETAKTLEANSKPDYKKQLEKELSEIRNSEMWKTGEAVRALRPERQQKK